MKVKGIIKEVYEVEIEIDDSMSRREIYDKVEEEWHKIRDCGFEDKHFSETDYEYDYI